MNDEQNDWMILKSPVILILINLALILIGSKIKYFNVAEYQSFETERLLLKPSETDDALFFLELLNSEKWLKYIGDRNVKTVEAAEDYIQSRILTQFESHGFANYTVIRKSDGIKMGVCGLYDREGVEGIDIGFAFLPKYENQGFAFEAASKMVEAGWKVFNIAKLHAYTTQDNHSSKKLLEKLGMTCIDRVMLPNDTEETLKYELNLNFTE
jgi:[ribosomal protein S5]-alanine N-acetyltransferase